ncbi:MAG TPA: M20 family metallopeptidase [Ktedonobacteraceae bacterium]|nr:M20 family metallopeptidase [Ktedonobacteraceae bacterium]
MNTQQFVAQAEKMLPQYLDDLRTIVNIDSGSYTKAGVDRVSDYLSERFAAFGFNTRLEWQQQYGHHLVATHTGNASKGPRILLIGHIDTVFPEGEVAKRPFTIGSVQNKPIATGPGVLDMKSGVLIGMYGLHLLMSSQQAHYQRVTFVCNSDEEIGSPSSKPLIQALAKEADAAIVLEPGRLINTVVSSRRGSGQYRVEVRGVSAHAGVEPQRGRNAILELSYQVQKMQALNGTVSGTTLSVGIIRGGERTNVVPDYAYCDMDVRVSDPQGLKAIEEAMRNVTSQHELDDTQITLSGGMACMPFERNNRNAHLVQLVKEAGSELGLKIEDVGSGGASDANNTAAVGTPTIDGLGAGGGLAHNPGEYIELDYLPVRIALLAGLVGKIGK